eukprot:Mrub_11551.p1 GENE.Mrub_11551~~Mrub_11551.p1  ORF type:complete len:143 (-),score=4.07 Mrub_11551:109-537(-)
MNSDNDEYASLANATNEKDGCTACTQGESGGGSAIACEYVCGIGKYLQSAGTCADMTCATNEYAYMTYAYAATEGCIACTVPATSVGGAVLNAHTHKAFYQYQYGHALRIKSLILKISDLLYIMTTIYIVVLIAKYYLLCIS